ncbi:hypothetical protein [Rubritalea tangerina]|uniref:Uncharacterized protein n=1 Tax=Rubritalea tangerina TaxID=430798 RepID=A0ABW4Z914_9BACT
MTVSAHNALAQLKISVSNLALDAKDQLKIEQRVDITDELALEYDNWYHATIYRDDIGMTPERRSTLDLLDKYLSSMKPELFDEELLSSDLHWFEVRRIARQSMAEWGWEH